MNRKNIVFYVTKQYMKQNKKRTFTTFLGIVFMVLLMTCVFVGKDTALKYLEKMAEKNSGSWHYCAYDVNGNQYEKIKNLSSITETAVSEEIGFTEFKQSENEKRPYLNIKAYTENCFDWRNIELVSGRFPENEQELIISESAVEDGAKVSIGDKISAEFFTRSITGIDPNIESTVFSMVDFFEIHYGETLDVPEGFAFYGANESFRENKNMTGEKQTYKVVGIMETPYYEATFHAGYAALTYEKEPRADSFNVTMKTDLKKCDNLLVAEGQLYDVLGEEVETESNSMLLSFIASSEDSTVNILVIFVQMFFVVFILIASIILIYNLFNMSFEERSKYLGMLSSVGATGKQKRSSVYFEAFYLLLYALPVGFLAAIGVIKAGMLAIRPYVGMLMELSGSSELEKVSIVFSEKSIMMIFIVCIAAVLVSAYLPARKIGKVGAIASIRGEHTGKKQYATFRFAIKKGSGAALLAGNTLKRQKRKTKGIVGAAAIVMIIVIVTTFGASTVTKMVRYKMVESYTISENPSGYEYCLAELDCVTYESLKEEIIKNDSVTDYMQWYSGMFFGRTPNESYSEEYWKDCYSVLSLYYPEGTRKEEMLGSETNTISIIAVDQKTYEEIAENSGCAKEMIAKKNSAIVVQDGEISTESYSVAEYEAKKYQFYEIEKMTDKKIGEDIPVQFYNSQKEKNEEIQFTVAGYTTNEQLDETITIHDNLMWLIVNEETAESLRKKTMDENGEGGMHRSLYFNVDDVGGDLIEKLENLAKNDNSKTFIFQNTAEQSSIQVTISTAINSVIEILAVCFVVLTSLLCLLNLYNSIRGRVESRKKEFAIMASVGMTKKQMKKMLLFECIGILGKSMFVTIVIATPVIYGLWKLLISYFGYLSFMFPWVAYLVAMSLSGIVIFIITILCFKHQKTENIMDDIRTESV